MNEWRHLVLCRTAICRVVFCSLALMAALGFFNATCTAQTDDDDEAPPPIKQLSKDERTKLSAEATVKGHTVFTLDLMNKRMENAESLNTNGHFEEMFKELGSFNALMDEALKFLTTQDKDKNKVLYNFKKLDIGLRLFMPRLETIRRDLPSRFDPYVKRLIKFISEAREKALEPMFGNTVVPKTTD